MRDQVVITIVLFFLAVGLTLAAALMGLVRDVCAARPAKTLEEIAAAEKQYESDHWAGIYFKVFAVIFWMLTGIGALTCWLTSGN